MSGRRSRRPGRAGPAAVLLGSALLAASCAGLRPPPPEAAELHKVGVETLTVVDEERSRILTTELWYPALDDARETDQGYAFFYRPGRAARGASPLPGPHPLILLSHGSGGTRFDQAWLAEHLASRGFVVAAPVHPGNTWGDHDPYVSLRIWERPRDVSAVLDHLLADERFGPLVDEGRVGAAGHSMGGYTVLAAAGARYDLHRIRAHCAEMLDDDPPCVLAPNVDKSRIDYGPSDDSFKDPRIRAVLAFAPAVGPGFDPASASDVEVPVHIVAGGEDDLTPLRHHARRWATVLRAELTVLGQADHYSFVSPCRAFVKLWPWATACRDPDGVDRADVQRRLAPLASAYFRQALR